MSRRGREMESWRVARGVMLLMAGCGSLGAAAWAQAESPEPIITDRPDFTESTETVPAARTQIEGG